VSTAVKTNDSTLTKRKCKEVLSGIFGAARVDEYKMFLSNEVGRLVAECQGMSAAALDEFAEGCRAVTEEEVTAIDTPDPVSESSEEEPPVKPVKRKARSAPAKKVRAAKVAKVDMSEQIRKLMTQHLKKLIAVAVQEKDASLTKKKCRELLAVLFGESRVEEHKAHIGEEVVRMVTEFRELEEDALAKIVEESRAVTEEEVKALDNPPAAESSEEEDVGKEDEAHRKMPKAKKMKEKKARKSAAATKSRAPTVDISEQICKLMTTQVPLYALSFFCSVLHISESSDVTAREVNCRRCARKRCVAHQEEMP
jgi:hypothetical protein